MHQDKPFVSVIIPVYNGEKYLTEAVESIHLQNYNPLEIIIIDDGSTDKTAQIAKNIKGNVKYRYQTNKGPAAARNRGIRLAKSRFLAFLDADDLWPENKLQVQVAKLLSAPHVDIIMGRIKFIKLPGAAGMDVNGPQIDVYLGAGLFRKSVFDKVGEFDETLRFSEDRDWFCRAHEMNVSMIVLQENTLLYRLHENNMTRNKTIKDFQYLRILKKSIDRRRQQNQGLVKPLPRLSDFDEAKKQK